MRHSNSELSCVSSTSSDNLATVRCDELKMWQFICLRARGFRVCALCSAKIIRKLREQLWDNSKICNDRINDTMETEFYFFH